MEKEKKKLTPMSELGRYGLAEYLVKSFPLPSESLIIGPGDDAAAFSENENLTLITSDMMLEGTQFNLVYTPLPHLGYKTVIRGISDIYAMGGVPGHILISLGISSRFAVEHIDEIYSGISKACRKYGCDIAGGDISSSVNGLIINITATGSVSRSKIIKRNGAALNDLICVTGDLGAAYMGLQLLEREKLLFEKGEISQPNLSGYEYIIGRELKPEIPVHIFDKLNQEEIHITSMTDICDGLAPALLSLCHASSKGCRIYYDKIPIDTETAKMAEEFKMDPVTGVLSGGDDFEFLFTVPLTDADKISKIDGVSIIGHITSDPQSYLLILPDQQEVTITSRGWGTDNIK